MPKTGCDTRSNGNECFEHWGVRAPSHALLFCNAIRLLHCGIIDCTLLIPFRRELL
ncbi:hypothetical protein Pla52n_12510 [Stieleria varia]|uniref:Uncharacterized protein n=1 Tax=Stieleria varia TaxID=2528005 RepID=A0A5C6B157_9BACT|nr:hypothetical protein Pla52n_12510 [Stieleria varia]